MKTYLKRHVFDFIVAVSLLIVSSLMIVGFAVAKKSNSLIASIYIKNELSQKIDLDKETSKRELTIQGAKTEMVIEIDHDYIAVKESHCPAQTCVKMNPLTSSGTIVCAYNQVLIQVGESDMDVEV